MNIQNSYDDRTPKRVLFVVLTALFSLIWVLQSTAPAYAAACVSPATDYGKVSNNVSIPANATYRVWTRMFIPDTTNSSYLLEIDGSKCYSIGGNGVQTSSWVWVAHQGGNVNSKIDVSLTQGAHSFKLIGEKPGVRIDRVVFTSDLACAPTGNGDNCNVPSDTTAPTVRITEPLSNATVSGTVNVTAAASDNVGISKVEFYLNSSLLSADTTSPYSFQWNSTSAPNDTQILTAKAFDTSGSVASDSIKISLQNGDKQAPTAPTGLAGSAPAYNKVLLTWKASTDNTGIKGYTISRGGVPIADVANITTYTDIAVTANSAYNYKVLAFDAAGNKSANSTQITVRTPTVADSEAPSKPNIIDAIANSSTQIDVTWEPSSDNIGISGYDVYRKLGSDQAQKVAGVTDTSYGDTNLKPDTTYTYFIVARDASGNSSQASSTASAKTKSDIKKSVVRGTIRNVKTQKSIRHASVIAYYMNNKHIYQANRQGTYTIRNLERGRYNISYRAPGYYSRSYAMNIQAGTIVTKDVLLQKR